MDYKGGRTLNYDVDLFLAAEILADIHSVELEEKHSLVEARFPLQEILEECEEMFACYETSLFAEKQQKKIIRRLLKAGQNRVKNLGPYKGRKCCINTELNSGNFLICGKEEENSLIDWEKPLYGDPAQDLGHFLAPTTTFWKTDTILGEGEMEGFLEAYKTAVAGRFETKDLKTRVRDYIPITCLRGITWCAMAYVEYQAPNKSIRNLDTLAKIKQYLEPSFLEQIEKRYFSSNL